MSGETGYAMSLGSYTSGCAFLGQSSGSPYAGSTMGPVSVYSVSVLIIYNKCMCLQYPDNLFI